MVAPRFLWPTWHQVTTHQVGPDSQFEKQCFKVWRGTVLLAFHLVLYKGMISFFTTVTRFGVQAVGIFPPLTSCHTSLPVLLLQNVGNCLKLLNRCHQTYFILLWTLALMCLLLIRLHYFYDPIGLHTRHRGTCPYLKLADTRRICWLLMRKWRFCWYHLGHSCCGLLLRSGALHNTPY